MPVLDRYALDKYQIIEIMDSSDELTCGNGDNSLALGNVFTIFDLVNACFADA